MEDVMARPSKEKALAVFEDVLSRYTGTYREDYEIRYALQTAKKEIMALYEKDQ